MTLTFDLGGHRDCRSYASWYFVRVPSANFGDTTTIRLRFMDYWANTAQTDHVTLRPWPLTLEIIAPVAYEGRRRTSVYQVWSSSALTFADMRTMCVSINGPGDPDLWPFDLETGMRVASKVENLSSNFGHARPLGFRIIRYIRTDRQTDRQTDRRTDGQKQRLLPPSLRRRGHKICTNSNTLGTYYSQ